MMNEQGHDAKRDPVTAAFACLQSQLDATRPALSALLRRPGMSTRPQLRWPLWLPLGATGLLVLGLLLRPQPERLPDFASTLQWTAPSDAFGPALPGAAADWTKTSRLDWTSDSMIEGATR